MCAPRKSERTGNGGRNDDAEGPFPLSGNWWDEQAWARVEWDVEIEDGVIARCHCDQDGMGDRWDL